MIDSQTQKLNLPVRGMVVEVTIPKGGALDMPRILGAALSNSSIFGATVLGDSKLTTTDLVDSADGASTIARQTVMVLEVGGVDAIKVALRNAFIGGVENVLGDIEATAGLLQEQNNIVAAKGMMDLADKLRERTIDDRFKLKIVTDKI